MRKKIKRTIHLSGYVFWALIVIAGLFVLIARPQLSAKLLVEEDGKIIAPVGEPVDVYYIIKNDGLTKAVVENVFIYDTATNEPLRTTHSYPKHQFNVWPGDEKLVRMEVVQPQGVTELEVALNVAYQSSKDVAPSNNAVIRWE